MKQIISDAGDYRHTAADITEQLVPDAIVKGENRVPNCEKNESGIVVERAVMK